MEIKFNWYYRNRHYVVVAFLDQNQKIESMSVYLIYCNGSIVRRKFLEVTYSLSEELRRGVVKEIHKRSWKSGRKIKKINDNLFIIRK